MFKKYINLLKFARFIAYTILEDRHVQLDDTFCLIVLKKLEELGVVKRTEKHGYEYIG